MSFLPLVDEMYESFARSLPPTLARAAGALAATLKLVPEGGLGGDGSGIPGDVRVAWSDVFKHEIVLAAPALFAEAVPDVPARIVREAVRAHLLGVLHAFAVDRVQDGEARPTGSTLALIDALRDARDRALRTVLDQAPGVTTSAGFPDEDTARAAAEEQQCLASPGSIDFPRYTDISRRKQGAAAPASAALAIAAGWPAQEVALVTQLFDALALALQMYDDAVDWSRDVTRGAAWAASLIGVARLTATEVSQRVRQSDVLFRLVDGGREQFAVGEALARRLQALAIADWARERREALTRVAREEQRSPGYAAREQELGGWLHEVLR
jgi:hypothetical protein